MPRCFGCGKDTPPHELREVNDDELFCQECRSLKPLTGGQQTEVIRMTKNNEPQTQQPVAAIEVYQDGPDDYRVSAYVRTGGIKLEINKTVEEIRDFFTRRRTKRLERGSARTLKSIPRED
jgi:hypothetical protein